MPVDPQLLEAAKGGDPAALNQVMILCRPNVRRYAAHHCVLADVDDAVQETLLIVLRYLPFLRSSGAFAVWLFRIVRRECLRLARKVFPSQVSFEILENTSPPKPQTDTELRLDIVNAIQALPDHYREVIVLRDFEELTIREIGVRLELLPETVKTRLYRGRVLLRDYLEG